MPKFKALPPLEELQKEFNYDPETGIVTARVSRGTRKKGSVVGRISNGYRRAKYKRVEYELHRIIWFLHYKIDPQNLLIDHVNGVRDDNRIVNLRLATRQQNQSNIKAAGFRQHRDKYQATIMFNGKNYYIGTFHSAEEAETAYRSKARELRGEFARQA